MSQGPVGGQSPNLGGSFKQKTSLLGGLNNLMKGQRNNTSSFTPTNATPDLAMDAKRALVEGIPNIELVV